MHIIPSKRNGFVLAVLVSAALAGCSGAAEEGTTASSADQTAMRTQNGLKMVNGLKMTNGLKTMNGLKSTNGLMSTNGLNARNGLRTTNGIRTANGLDSLSGLSTLESDGSHSVIPDGSEWTDTSDGTSTVAYMLRCALSSNHSITRTTSSGSVVTYTGEAGFADYWMTSPLDKAGEEWVTSCLIAHLNGNGQHISFEMRAAAPSVGYGGSAFFPEGGFYGNIFATPAHAYACKDWNGMSDFASGRMCGGFPSGQCPITIDADSCGSPSSTPACSSHGSRDGYVSCGSDDGATWTRPVATLLYTIAG